MRSIASLMRLLVASLVLVSPAIPGYAADRQAQAPAGSPPAQAVPSAQSDAIPVAEIAAQAATATEFLRALTLQLAPSAEVDAIQRALPEASKLIDLEGAATADILQRQPSLASIASQQELWKARQVQTDKWLSVLTRRTTRLQDGKGRLGTLQATWSRTQESAQTSKAPAPVLQQVADLLAGIAAAQVPLQAQLTVVLDLQSRVAQEAARCETILAQIAQAQEAAMGGILVRDSRPIWSAEGWAQGRAVLRTRVRGVVGSRWDAVVAYGRDPSQGWPLHVGSFLVLAGLLWAGRRRLGPGTTAGEAESATTAVFRRPYAAALMLPLLLASAPTSAVPPILRRLAEIVALVPAIRLTRPLLDRRLTPWLYALALLFLFDTVQQDYAGVPGIAQALLMTEMLAGIATLGYALTRGGLRPAARAAQGEHKVRRVVRGTACLVLGAFGVALVSGVLGYMRLGRLLSAGILGSAALAVTLYACYLVLTGLAGFALRMWPLQRLQMVQRHRDLLERRTGTVLRWAATGGWTIRTLDYVGLFQPTLSFGAAVLGARLQRGSMSISLGDILDFVLTVWVAYLVSAFIRFALHEDVYPRMHLPRGISYAVSSLLNYVIVALGFVLALGALGMDLSKVTLLAGAFGVGIGFGLQSVVNNFVSGLILLFERPIHVGDAVEVGTISGEVRRIGIRASTVRTGQGAEIIVPNAQLITEHVTNWTLSDRQRRIDLPVGVNYSARPGKVMEMLEAVAHAHPGVLNTPAPKAYFTGFGDSAIHFELRAWTDHFEQWFQIRSELATAVYEAGHAAGMSFPFPQREVRLLRDGPDHSAADASGTLLPAPQPEGVADARPGHERALEKPAGGGRG